MGSSLLDPSVDLTAIMTRSDLSALLIDFLANLSLSKIINVWSPQVPQEDSAFLLRKKDPGTSLASISPGNFLSRRKMYFADIL